VWSAANRLGPVADLVSRRDQSQCQTLPLSSHHSSLEGILRARNHGTNFTAPATAATTPTITQNCHVVMRARPNNNTSGTTNTAARQPNGSRQFSAHPCSPWYSSRSDPNPQRGHVHPGDTQRYPHVEQRSTQAPRPAPCAQAMAQPNSVRGLGNPVVRSTICRLPIQVTARNRNLQRQGTPPL